MLLYGPFLQQILLKIMLSWSLNLCVLYGPQTSKQTPWEMCQRNNFQTVTLLYGCSRLYGLLYGLYSTALPPKTCCNLTVSISEPSNYKSDLSHLWKWSLSHVWVFSSFPRATKNFSPWMDVVFSPKTSLNKWKTHLWTPTN